VAELEGHRRPHRRVDRVRLDDAGTVPACEADRAVKEDLGETVPAGADAHQEAGHRPQPSSSSGAAIRYVVNRG
jgi:hypothetical protein